jgi:hypothetical protein
VRSSRAPVSILTSGVGLGTYVPALLNQRAFRETGQAADVEVIEGYFTSSALARHLDLKAALQKNFELAQAARGMTKDVEAALDPASVENLLRKWVEQRRCRFIVWSGFWFSVLHRYVALVPELRVEVDICRIDSIPTPSFNIQRRLPLADCREIWLWNWPKRELGWRIDVTAGPPLPLHGRERRLVVHGGGWGLGTYLDVLPQLSRCGYALDVVVPPTVHSVEPGHRDRLFTPAPDWHPWKRDAGGDLAFPPLCEVLGDGHLRSLATPPDPPAHALLRGAMGLVTKPGGGSLLDSLAAATPLIMLRPWGESEARNADLWEALGFGVRFDRWRRTGCDSASLAALHRNLLLAQDRGAAYPHETRRFAA